ncbi:MULTISPECIES: hypothetical protein [Microcoleaceae]|nr:hypothetical protein [Tychonema sp. LEGE 06208]MBE9164607.1 hypothetical protein [Tychonema sp. LEGE 06208]
MTQQPTTTEHELSGIWFDRPCSVDRMQAALKEPSGGRAENMKYWRDGVF